MWLTGSWLAVCTRPHLPNNRCKARSVCAFVFQGPKLGAAAAAADNQLITKSPHEMRKPPPLNETYALPSLPFLPLPLTPVFLLPLGKQKSCKRESDVEEEGSFEFMKR